MAATNATAGTESARRRSRRRIVVVVGTRPEAVKLAPIVREFSRRGRRQDVCLLATSQHRELLDQVLPFFGLVPDVDLNLMRAGQSPSELAGRMFPAVDRVLAAEEPDLVVAQGDTTTVLVSALCAFHRQIPFAHVEAGLRSGVRSQPFPEEMNRSLTGWLAELHFAPTPAARDQLLAERVPEDRIHVTGNTVVDALLWAERQELPPCPVDSGSRPLLLVTVHRRESLGVPLREICRALADIANSRDVDILIPVHPNPEVHRLLNDEIGAHRRIHLAAPMAYPQFVSTLKSAHIVLSDSGGVQEEAPVLGKPVLVLRDVTERVEGIESGNALLTGADRERIVYETLRLLDDPVAYARMAQSTSPYGDGRAAERIVNAIERFMRLPAAVPPVSRKEAPEKYPGPGRSFG